MEAMRAECDALRECAEKRAEWQAEAEARAARLRSELEEIRDVLVNDGRGWYPVAMLLLTSIETITDRALAIRALEPPLKELREASTALLGLVLTKTTLEYDDRDIVERLRMVLAAGETEPRRGDA